MSFDGFVSYSHAADGLLAPKLQDGLQRMGRTLFQRRALHIFRDDSTLSASPHLWNAIETSLLDSEWFIFLASPRSAMSEWVDREVASWLKHKPLEKLLIVVTDGLIGFTPSGKVDCAGTDCLPDALIEVLEAEPRWLDLRWAHDEEQLDLRNGRFRAAIADLAAPMHGISKDDLESEDVRQQRRSRRLAVAALVVVSALAVAASVAAVVAVRQKNSADHATQLAVARGLSAEARAQASTDIDLALLLAVEALRRDDSVGSRTSLLTVLESGRRIHSFVAGLPERPYLMEFDDASETLWILTTDGILQGFTPETFDPVGAPLPNDFGVPIDMDISVDGTIVAVANNQNVLVVDLKTGDLLFETAEPNVGLELDRTGRWLLLYGYATPEITLIDLEAGEIVGRLQQAADSLAQWPSATFLADELLVSTNGIELQHYDFALEPRGEPIAVPNDLTAWSLTVSPQGDRVVIDHSDGNLVLVDATTLEPVGPVIELRGSRLSDIAFDPAGLEVAISSDDGSVTVRSTIDSSVVAEFHGLSGATGTALLPGRRALSVSFTDGQAVEWSIDSPTAWGESIARPDNVMALASDPESGVAYEIRTEGSVRVLDESGAEVRSADFGPRMLTLWAADLHAGTNRLAVGMVELDPTASEVTSRRVLILDSETLEPVNSVEIPQLDENRAFAFALRFDPAGSQLAVGTATGTLMIVDVESGGLTFGPEQIEDSQWIIGSLIWSPDGGALYAGGQDGVLRVFDTSTWSVAKEVSLTPTVSLMRSGVSFDGAMAIIPSESGELFVFDTVLGEVVGEPLTAGGTQLQAAAISRDGATVAALSRDGTLRLWDMETRQHLGPAVTSQTGFAIALAPFGSSGFITGGLDDGVTVLWSGDPQTWIDTACRRAGRNLTIEEWRSHVGKETPSATCAEWGPPA